MFASQWEDLAILLDEHSGASALSRAQAVCAVCVEAAGVSGVALSIHGTRLNHLNSTVCATDAVSDSLDESQLGLAEGPITDALRDDHPVLVPDLSQLPPARWLWFTPAALHIGARALFVFPLGAGRVHLGALSLYRSTIGALGAHEIQDARFLAGVARSVLITGLAESDPSAEPGAWAVGDDTGFQARVYQAVGVATVQLDLNADDALARIRAHAYTRVPQLIGVLGHVCG